MTSGTTSKSGNGANFVIASFLYVSGRHLRKQPRFLLHAPLLNADGPGNQPFVMSLRAQDKNKTATMSPQVIVSLGKYVTKC